MATRTVWEYNVVQGLALGGILTLDMLYKKLTELGIDGWELITAIPSKDNEEPFIIFKRPMAIKPTNV
jgi:hypothetical protein